MRRSEEEFKAEVFRRSREYKARQKKRRKAAIGVCLPVFVLAVISSVVLIGFQPQFKMSAIDNAETANAGEDEKVRETAEVFTYSNGMNGGDEGNNGCNGEDLLEGEAEEGYALIEGYTLIEVEPYPQYFTESKRFTDFGKMSQITALIEQIESSQTSVDEVDVSGEEFNLKAAKSSGEVAAFTILDGRYLKTESGEWVSVDAEKTEELFNLIASLSSDKEE